MKKLFCIIIFLNIMLTHGLFADKDEEKEFIVSFTKSDVGFNPLHVFSATEAQICTAIFEGLVTYNPYTMEPLPGVARYWEISKDRKKYRFYLRDNARYWDGKRVTSKHFRDTWLKLIDPREKAEYSFLFDVVKGVKDYRSGKTKKRDQIGIYAVSDTILDVELEKPDPNFLKILCHHSFVPVHPDFLKIDDWKKEKIIPGNGSFYIFQRTKNKIKLVKNNLYWDSERVKLSSIIIRFDDDPEKVTKGFNNGEIHWAGDNIDYNKVDYKGSVIFHPMYATYYFYFYCAAKPWNNSDVRRGLALLLPWKKIRKECISPAKTLVPRTASYPVPEGIAEQNTEEGLRLLDKAGYPEGKGLPVLKIKIPGGVEARSLAGIMKETWEENIKIEVEIVEYPYQIYYNEIKKGGYAVGSISWIGDFADPLAFLSMWISGSNLNDAKFSSEEYDKLIDKSMTEKGDERYRTLSRAEGVILNTAVILPINHSSALNLIDLDVIGGWFPNPLDIHPFKYVNFKKPELPPGLAMTE